MTSTSQAQRDGFLASMDRELARVLDPLLRRGARYALLDFPDHGNVGDSAIWLGEKAHLRRKQASIVYACDVAGYSEGHLLERLGGGVILLHGGGNLGDLWPAHQRLRERVIEAFPHNPIIQLPQSVWFGEKANLARARAVFDAHPDLTLLLRDERSLALARNEFRAPSLLCPDLSVALGALPKRPPRQDVLWLLRDDIESRGHRAQVGDGKATDWRTDRRSWVFRMNRVLKSARRLSSPSTSAWRWPLLGSVHQGVWNRLAQERVDRGCALLSRGRVVVTDRLHGHLLSVLLGIPHVVLDNSYGKIRSYYETWTRTCGLAHWARTPEEASVLAGRLVEGEGAREAKQAESSR